MGLFDKLFGTQRQKKPNFEHVKETVLFIFMFIFIFFRKLSTFLIVYFAFIVLIKTTNSFLFVYQITLNKKYQIRMNFMVFENTNSKHFLMEPAVYSKK